MFNKIKLFFFTSRFFNPPILEKRTNLILDLIGHLFFVAMFVLAWIYYKERMIPWDSSFFCFKIIHFGTFNIEEGRYGAFLTQILPLLFLKAGCSLETFLRVYSVSFVIVNYLFFIVIHYVLKNKYVSVALILALCLAYRYAFYIATSEVHQAFAPCLLLFALVSYDYASLSKVKKMMIFAFAALIVVFISYVHTLFVIVIGFILAYELIRNKKWKDSLLLSIIIFFIAYFSIVILSIPADSYSGKKIPELSAFVNYVPHIFTLPSYIFFSEFVMVYYKVLIFLFFLLLIVFAFQKRFLILTFYSLFFLAFIILILITFRFGESPIMQENYYILFGIFIAVPLSFEILKKIPKTFAILSIIFLLSYSDYKIWKSHFQISQRNGYIERIITYGRTFDEKKFIVNDQNIDWNFICADWALSFESLLLSTIQSPDSAVTFYTTQNIHEYDSLLSNKNLFIGADFAPFWFTSNSLNQKYFRLKNTVYRKLNSPQSDSVFNESFFNKDSLSIKLDLDCYKVVKFLTATIPVRITNRSHKLVPSTITPENQTYLSYHIYKNDKMIIPDGKRSKFEVDLMPGKEYVQGLTIWLPPQRGLYTVEVDVLSENKRWWGINKRFILVVY